MAEIKRTFGERIGGSRYDEWHAGDVITLDDVSQMTAAQRVNLITKDNVWPKPDYAKLMEEGVSPVALYYRKLVRDSLPAKANKDGAEHQYTDYVRLVDRARKVMENVRSVRDMDAASTFLDDYGFVRDWRAQNIYLTNKTYRTVRRGTDSYRLERERQNKGFLMTDNEKLLHEFSFYQLKKGNFSYEEDGGQPRIRYEPFSYCTSWFYPKTKDQDISNLSPDTWIVTTAKNNEILQTGFPSRDLAEEWVLSNFELEKRTKSGSRKKRYTPPQLKHIVQSEDEVPITMEGTTGKDLLTKFGFRGGEFGEYESQTDRQANLDMSAVAFHTLAKTLGMTDKDVSLGNQLGIAFGARGRGGFAAAHYEPMLNVINLTKLSGAGSLGHEWFHALDSYIGRAIGLPVDRLASEEHPATLKQKGYPKFAELVSGLKEKTLTGEEEHKEQDKRLLGRRAEIRKSLLRMAIPKTEEQKAEQEKIVDRLLSVMDNGYTNSEMVDGIEHQTIRPEFKTAFEDYCRFAKNNHLPSSVVRNESFIQWQADVLKNMNGKISGYEKSLTVSTEFLENAKKLDQSFTKTPHGYWSSNCEMFARAGAAYVLDKSKELGLRDDYLSGHANGPMIAPQGKERERLNELFDSAFEELKEKSMLHEAEYGREKE